MREYYTNTVAAALAHNASGPRPGTTSRVTPWLAIGCGYLRLAKGGGAISFDFAWDYKMVYSEQANFQPTECFFIYLSDL